MLITCAGRILNVYFTNEYIDFVLFNSLAIADLVILTLGLPNELVCKKKYCFLFW